MWLSFSGTTGPGRLAPWPLRPAPSAHVCAHHKDRGVLPGARGGAGRDFWQGRASTWPVWQENERLEGLLAPCLPWGWRTYFQRGLVQRMLMLFLPRQSPTSAASQTSTACSVCGPGMPGVRPLESWLFYPRLCLMVVQRHFGSWFGGMRVCGARGRTLVLCND